MPFTLDNSNPPKRWYRSRSRVLGVALTAAVLACGIVSLVVGLTRTCTTSTTDAITAPPPSTTTATTPGTGPIPSRPLIMLVGDSITEEGADPARLGWVTLLQNKTARSMDIVNRGISGWNTRQSREKALPVLVQELQRTYSPTLITVWLGANDAAVVDSRVGFMHLPVDEYRANLVYMVEQLHANAPTAKILLIPPPIVDDATRERIRIEINDPKPADRSNEEVRKYAAACVGIRDELPYVDVLDLYTYFMETYPDATERGMFLRDGLHYSMDGHRVVFQQLYAKLRTLLTDKVLETRQID